MADKRFEDAEVERTTRWVEHEQFQKGVMRWKIAFALIPVLGVAIYLLFFAK